MFESSLLTTMAADGTLTALFGTYGTPARPAFFADMAPQDAENIIDGDAYLVFSIRKNISNSIAVDEFTVMFDIFSRGTSKKNQRAAAYEIEALLDQKSITSSRFSTIRFYRFSAGPVPTEDPRDSHYNVQMTARAGRSGWMVTL
jgi:hypothetical protein